MSNYKNLDVQFTFMKHARKVTDKTDTQGFNVQTNGDRNCLLARTKMYIRLKHNIPKCLGNGIPIPAQEGKPQEMETIYTPMFNGIGGVLFATFHPAGNIKKGLKSLNADFSNQQTANSGFKYAITPLDNEFEKWLKEEMVIQFKKYKFERIDDMFDSNATILAEMANDLSELASELEESYSDTIIANVITTKSQTSIINQLTQDNPLNEPTN